MMMDENKHHPSIEDLSFEDITFGDSSNNISSSASSSLTNQNIDLLGGNINLHLHHPQYYQQFQQQQQLNINQYQQQQYQYGGSPLFHQPQQQQQQDFVGQSLLKKSLLNHNNNNNNLNGQNSPLGNPNLSLLSIIGSGGGGSSSGSPNTLISSKNPNKEKRPKTDKSDRHAVLISTKGDRINLAILLKQLEECGPVRAHHFRERQNFGFVQFLDSDSADNAIARLNNRDIDGQIITIERIKRITPGKDPRVATVGSPQCSSLPAQLPSMIENKPDSTLVLKNLPFNLRQVQLQEILENINPSAPQSVNFHYDSIGVFRGMAFVKYRLVEDAVKVFDALNGSDVYGRRVRLEYKRKVSKSSEIPPEVLEDDKLRKVWEQLREFKEEGNPIDITFSNFTGVQRMYIHNMAEKLKLSHTSVGEEPNRSIIVSNKKPTTTTNGSGMMLSGTPSKDDTSFLLSSSPSSLMSPNSLQQQQQMNSNNNNNNNSSYSGISLSTTPTNNGGFSSLSSTPTGSSMFGMLGNGIVTNKSSSSGLESLSGSFGNHGFLRSTPPLSTSLTSTLNVPNPNIHYNNQNNQNNQNNINNINNNSTFTTTNSSTSTKVIGNTLSTLQPNLIISNSQPHQQQQQQKHISINNTNSSNGSSSSGNVATSWEKSPSQLLSNPLFTTRGFGIVRDRSFSTDSSQQLNNNNNQNNTSNSSNNNIIDNIGNNSQLNNNNNNNLSTSPTTNNLWRKEFLNTNNNSNNNFIQQGFNSLNQNTPPNSYTSSNNINIQAPIFNNIQQQQQNNTNGLASSPSLRQPKAPDGTKGFSLDYRNQRKLL